MVLFVKFLVLTHEQNGVADKRHRHIVEIARSLLLIALLRNFFWLEAGHTTINLINMIPSSFILGTSPYEKFYGHGHICS